MYKFFKNTGIQFFGIPWDGVNPDLFNKRYEKYDNAEMFNYATKLFQNEWIPISLDGERNLIRFYLGMKPRSHIVYCIDTTIRENDKSSLVKNDIGQVLPVQTDLKSKKNIDVDNIKTTSSINEWIESIDKRKRQKVINELKKSEEEFNEKPYKSYKDAYKVLVYELIANIDNFIPEIEILTDKHKSNEIIDAHLSLDLGNTRTIGLFVEKEIGTSRYNLGNGAPLQILNYKELEEKGQEYLDGYSDPTKESIDRNYLISSMVRFKRNIFQKYPDTDNSFVVPSIVVIGSEAEELDESVLEQGISGISGPKRYLWCKKEEPENWQFHEPNASDISGKVLEHISLGDDDDEYEDDFIVNFENPVNPTYPRRTLMIFVAIEIIYQAVCQINSLHYRKKVGNPLIKRRLKNVILSFPTAMPFWERERLKKQFEKALEILNKMDVLGKGIDDVTIELGSDEATCSQLSFLYGEARKFHGKSDKFFKWVSQSRGAQKLRLASLDIGGGTTDLMISDYAMQNPSSPQSSDMLQQLKYSDGVSIAGDDILKSLISEYILPMFREILITAGRPDNLYRFFGTDPPEADKHIRVEAMNGLLIPIAELYMHLMEKGYAVQESLNGYETLSHLNEYLIENNLRKIKEFGNLTYIVNNNIFEESDFDELIIPNLIPNIQHLEKIVKNAYLHILLRYAVVINEYKPNFLVLGGRTTSLPIIRNLLSEWITLSPQRIIQLNNYYTGPWYPFSVDGRITDPKTGVVVGNSIAHLSYHKLLKDVNITAQGSQSDFTMNFIGVVQEGVKVIDRSAVRRLNGSSTEVFNYFKDSYLLFRNIDDDEMPCNLMYSVKLKRKKGKPAFIVADGGHLEVTLDCSDAKKKIKHTDVKGELIIPGDNASRRPAMKEDIVLEKQTLFGNEYYLDTGKFPIVALNN